VGQTADVDIPGQTCSFGIVIDVQAAGDLAILESRAVARIECISARTSGAGLKALNMAFTADLGWH
jgi:hypothetical protein